MDDCLTVLTAAFRAFGTAKQLARAGGCSVPTAQRYQRGETTPDVLTLARLMAQSRAIADAMLRLAGLDDLSLDIEQARLVRSLADLEQKRLAAHEALERARASHRAHPGGLGAAPGIAGVRAGEAAGAGGRATEPAP